MRCQQSHSLQLAVKVLYGFLAILVITVAVLASLGELSLTFDFILFYFTIKLQLMNPVEYKFQASNTNNPDMIP